MGIEPYLLKSGVRAVLHQRLVRRLCTCAKAGCAECRHTGYRGRIVLAELLPPLAGDLSEAVLSRRDAHELARLAAAAGMTTVAQRAAAAQAAGQTDSAEVLRVLGLAAATGSGG
jgi:type II secretory ATPase GspE/PulE/Tfp pilus assembly ATPase PilB-like protein